jgi:formamidopyrimidine-DNA glycosylase
VTIYLEALERFVVGQRLEDVRLASPFVLRTADPPLTEVRGRLLHGVRRIGKRLVLALEGDLFVVIHLMIAGRLHWHRRGARIPGKVGLAAFDFPNGTLVLTETSTKKRASIHVVRGETGLAQFVTGGVEPLEADLASFAEALTRENHTLKRALTDAHVVSGIGNAYSDEILHRARLSPVRLTRTLGGDEIGRLYQTVRDTLTAWIERLRLETGDGFPERVTAFREGMAVHGRYRKPCPVCGSPVQRIVYAEKEANYCATCQTGGRLLADRSLSRLLGDQRPKTIEELRAVRPREFNPPGGPRPAGGARPTARRRRAPSGPPRPGIS